MPQRRLRYTGRKLLLLALMAAIAGGLALADRAGVFGRARPSDRERYDGKTFRVVHVVDGDTLDVDISDEVAHHRTTRIRFWGVDTPETVKPNTPPQHYGKEASDFVKGVAGGVDVRLELDPLHTRDKYNRLLAYIYLPDGRMLNRVLVEEGYGYADPRFDHKYSHEFERLMNRARKAGRGLWKDLRPADLPEYLRQ